MKLLKCGLDSLDRLCTCFVVPGKLVFAMFGLDGNFTTSSIHFLDFDEQVKSCDFCLSRHSGGFLVFSSKSGCQYVAVEDGKLVPDTLSTVQKVRLGDYFIFISDRCLFYDSDSFYTLASVHGPTVLSLESKVKVSVNSEIGPQNRALLSKDKSILCGMHKVNFAGTDIITVTTNPTTGLYSIHWMTPELQSNTIQLKWSLALTQDNIIIASNTIPMNPLQTACTPWACAVAGASLKVLTRTGVLGCVDLRSSCPSVVGAVVLDSTDRETTANGIIDSASGTTATILLSCTNDRYFALTLQITATECTAVKICERFFIMPTEADILNRCETTVDAVRETRTMLPCCESLVRVPSKPHSNNNHPELLVLLGFHASFGLQLIIEDSSVPHLSSDERIKLLNVANKLKSTFCEVHRTHSLDFVDVENAGDTRRFLASTNCARTQQSAVYTLAQHNQHLEVSARFELDEESFCDDTQVHTARPAHSDLSLLVMLTSRRAQQTALYTFVQDTENISNNCRGQLLPFSPALYQSDQSSLGLFALSNCVVQITSSKLHAWRNNDADKKEAIAYTESWNHLLQKAAATSMRASVIDRSGSHREVLLEPELATIFTAQFVVCASATSLVAVCNDILVHVKVSTLEKELTLSVLHVMQLHATVCALTNVGEGTNDDVGAVLFISFWPEPDVSNSSNACDLVQIVHCSPSAGIRYLDQLELDSLGNGLTREPLRHLSALTLYNASAVQLYALLCAYPCGETALYHVSHNVRDNSIEHALARSLMLAGGLEAVMVIGAPLHQQFILSSVGREYCIAPDTMPPVNDISRADNLRSIITWRCNETLKQKYSCRSSIASVAKIPSTASATSGNNSSNENQVVWIEISNKSTSAKQSFPPALCFGHLRADQFSDTHAEDRLFISGMVVSLDMSGSKQRIVVLSADPFDATPLSMVAQQVVVKQGEVSVHDTESLKCVWRQRLASADPKMPLLGMVVGPESPPQCLRFSSARPFQQISTVLSLVHGHVLSDVVSGPSAVLCAVTLTTLQISEEHDKPAKVIPLGSIRLFVDIRKLSQTPPVVESNTTTASAVPPPEPRLDGFINNALHSKALAECVVLCLPGNTLSLVGWSSCEESEDRLRLCEYMRLDLQDKNAAVLEMVAVGDTHVVLSLALVGLEMYTLIPSSRAGAPTLQFAHAVAGVGCLWSELCVKRMLCDKDTGDINAELTMQNKMEDTRHEISLFLPSANSMLMGGVLSCEIRSVTNVY